MNKAILNQSIIAGTVCGAIFTAFSFGTYYTSIDSFAGFRFVYTWVPLMTVILLLIGFRLRKQLGGFISFKEVLQFGLVSYLVYEIIYAIVTLLLFIVIDPQLTKKLFDSAMRFTVSMMRNFGVPQNEIDKAVANANKQQVGTGVGNILQGIGWGLIWDFVVSLLVAFIVKKERPADLDFTQETTL